ncbi:unnamed protein product [Adineta steineri]|nr:unnamed protein product [Adineta steineri]
MVTLQSGVHITVRDLHVEDRVRINSYKTSEVLAIFRHYRSTILFIELHSTKNLSKPLRLTPMHSILVRKPHNAVEQYHFTRDVSVGDFVFSTSTHQMIKVTELREILYVDDYTYAPLTFEGTIVTNNITASCYATYRHSIMHIIMTPIRWWYWLLIQFEQIYLHKLSTEFCVHFVDWYLQLFFTTSNFVV